MKPIATRRLRGLRLAASGGATCLACLSLAACGAEETEDKGADSPADSPSHDLIGNRAPEISVVAMMGHLHSISLKKLRGKVVVVDFWGTFCEPCKKSFPKLQELNDKYADSGLEIVAISEDEAEDKDKIPTFVHEYGAKFNIAWDSKKSAAKLYNLPTMPSSFVIDRRGRVRYAHAGYRDGEEEQLERELKRLLKED